MRELDITVSIVHEDFEGKHIREHATATTSRITIQDCIEKFVGVLTSIGFNNKSIKDGIAEYAYCNCNLDILESQMDGEDDKHDSL
tara:strand:+ start:55529 stop:55786 length:258 start_codon:yes stop_codon:yes gene_type:complete